MNDLVSNRKAYHTYEILETLEAGILLLGTEIKSLRNHGGNLQDSYVIISAKGEAYLKNASIAPYRFGNLFNHEERRQRKLLLHKNELLRLKQKIEEKGLTLIPLAFYLKKNIVKVRLGLAKGKKNYDKRAALKATEDKKAISRVLKEYND